MKKAPILFLSAVFVFTTACSSHDEIRPIVPVAPEVSQVSLEDIDYRVGTGEDAIRLAQRHLALKQRSWGKILDVAEEDSQYYVLFETPKVEMRLLGQRKLIVEKDNGLVRPHKRR